ncbi:MAG: 7-carboxy-7-deazaguanine synthase QueE [Gammaproteobacteria bacterium]|nr:7-carboxy-7-deazaguanine synthase QueE [Gammaproteobacteria bacterium]MYF30116.1 7-carboxy-7-deazaguanine synthase QueE [Gammaproteobacteria bacterium]MYK47332.1 7-carboxy-7-deazaguanine synthase QueE [Gammaproteobacteria bacterium]
MQVSTDKPASRDTLRITEIFFSLQGEAKSVGRPTTFVRLTGCPLRCQYCDTAYAFTGGTTMCLDDICQRVAANPTRHVTVTGGEPLAQPGVHGLMGRLADAGYAVSLETSGALDIAQVDARVSRVVDFKTPGSGESHRNRFENVRHLRAADQVKFVICDGDDYEWAKACCAKHDLTNRVSDVLFSPSAGELDPTELADWILGDGLDVRFQIQLHKVLWGDEPGR